MEFRISDKKKKETFISLFHLIKYSSSQCSVQLLSDRFHIQGMDKAHVSLFELNLSSSWFDLYRVDTPTTMSFHTPIFYSMISTKSENQCMVFKSNGKNEDSILIEFVDDSSNTAAKQSGSYSKHFTLPLIDSDYEEMEIPETEYDVEFAISSKKITDMLSQLANFGDELSIVCSEIDVNFKTNGPTGEMRTTMLVENMSSYSIVEGECITLRYSLNYLNNMCITNKITDDIEFCLSNDRPMKVQYHLGGDGNHILFYIAPKVDED